MVLEPKVLELQKRMKFQKMWPLKMNVKDLNHLFDEPSCKHIPRITRLRLTAVQRVQNIAKDFRIEARQKTADLIRNVKSNLHR